MVPMADEWTYEENDTIVADYFAMLAEDVARRPYNKAQLAGQIKFLGLSRRAACHATGRTFGLKRNTLPGSYVCLIACRRA